MSDTPEFSGSYDETSSDAIERARLIDRLVDDELASAERRALLLELEHRPDGWRECALAFLEAQAFSDGFQSVMTDPPTADAETDRKLDPKARPADPVRSSGAARWPSMMAVAAGLMVAFSVGVASRGIWNESRDAEVQDAVGRPLASSNAPSESSGIDGATAGMNARQSVVPAETRSVSKVRVPFGDGSGGRIEDVVVPIVDADSGAPFLSRDANQIPPDVLQMLERYGPLERTRGYFPVHLGDGRRVVVPLERINVRRRAADYQ